jgi:superfamily II DNA or RNA helicase
MNCKHMVAVLLALREAQPSFPSARKKGGKKRVIQPPPSALYKKVAESLGRELEEDEARFVRLVQECYGRMDGRKITESDLHMLAGRSPGYGWNQINIAPKKPRDDYEFWLYVAWQMREKQMAGPPFMATVTDFNLIASDVKRWQRDKEIQKWKEWFRDHATRQPGSARNVLELRLLMLREEARLQYRTAGDAAFQDFRQAEAKRFSDQFEKGQLAIEPESLPIWSALYKPWSYETWWRFEYRNSSANAPLARVLRLPTAPARIVAADETPLPRATEPLRFELSEPADRGGNYRLRLVRADGDEPPQILSTFDGAPTLYLTEEGLFEGPAAGVLQTETCREIPSAALEAADGVRFLHANAVAVPARLLERVRTVIVKIKICCELEETYSVENVRFRISAEAPGMRREEFTFHGWQREQGGESQTRSARDQDEILIHDRAAQAEVARLVEPLGLKWDNYSGFWYFRLTKKTPELFANWLKTLPQGIEVFLDKELATLRDEPVLGAVSLDVAESGIDWFDLKVTLGVGDTTLSADELKLLLNARGGYVRLGKKGWRRLQFNLTPEEDEQLARLGLNPRDLTGEPQRFHALQLADEAAKRFLGPDRIERIQQRVGELKASVMPALPGDIRVQMRPYQTEGFHFLAYLASNRFGGVLADDMGLGKTIQALAWLAWIRMGAKANLPSLVVCPKSVMENWRSEAARFYPSLRVRLWRGESADELPGARENSDLLVVNYSQLRSLLPAITEARWQAAMLDEAQYIKNPDSQTAQATRALKAEYRLALTGTPIENRLLDLWSIMAFAMPGALGNRSHFLKRFDAKDDPLARRRLAARVRPFLLRRTKSQVAKDLPDRVEEDLLCEMEGEQHTLYRAELKRARQLILGLKTNKQLNEQRFNVLTSLLRLRQICCHPALVDEKLRDAESAKVAALEDLLESLMEEGHKVLVFSQFVTMLAILREKADERGWRHFYLAGETENRGELVSAFQGAEGSAVFFISLKAGGFGLNLTAASYVVLFDPWWNPAVENQAIDRTHRIGQASKVIAYRLLMRDSVEQKIRDLQKQKANLAQDVLGEERFAQSLTLDELKFLFAE